MLEMKNLKCQSANPSFALRPRSSEWLSGEAVKQNMCLYSVFIKNPESEESEAETNPSESETRSLRSGRGGSRPMSSTATLIAANVFILRL